MSYLSDLWSTSKISGVLQRSSLQLWDLWNTLGICFWGLQHTSGICGIPHGYVHSTHICYFMEYLTDRIPLHLYLLLHSVCQEQYFHPLIPQEFLLGPLNVSYFTASLRDMILILAVPQRHAFSPFIFWCFYGLLRQCVYSLFVLS